MIERVDDDVIVEAAYELGALAMMGGVRRQLYLSGMAQTLAKATGAEGVGVFVHLDGVLKPALATGIVGPWTNGEQSVFLDQTSWESKDRVIAQQIEKTPGPVFRRTAELMPMDEFRNTRLYLEFQKPRGIGDQITMCLQASDGASLLVAIARVGVNEMLSSQSVEIAQRLAPVIEQCWKTAHRQMPQWVRSLSPRRRLVLEFVSQGLDDHQIAREMGVRYHTVRAHLKDLFRMAGVRSRLHLMQSLHDVSERATQQEKMEPAESPFEKSTVYSSM